MKITASFNAKILVVEDYIFNQELIKEMLELMKCEVDTAEDGEQAVTQFNNHKYDLIFMDIQMPKKDGIQATKEIRGIEKSQGKPHTPIVALTANVLEEAKESYIEAGFDEFISKPLKAMDLEKVLTKYLGTKA